MPRNYKKKENKTRSYGYCSKENLEKAITAVREDNMSMGKAAKAYDIKKTTLYHHFKKYKSYGNT